MKFPYKTLRQISLIVIVSAILPACSTAPARRGQSVGKYYLNDRPPSGLSQAQLDAIMEMPDPVPRKERLAQGTLKPYAVMGKEFRPMKSLAPYQANGRASWYGMKYQGLPTSGGEPYDLMRLTAAHPLLPIPSYARVTNLENGRSIIVRVNDRGPFVSDRIIDLSYAGAVKLGFAAKGSALVSVEAILP
jgi:rare lipoprotein A